MMIKIACSYLFVSKSSAFSPRFVCATSRKVANAPNGSERAFGRVRSTGRKDAVVDLRMAKSSRRGAANVANRNRKSGGKGRRSSKSSSSSKDDDAPPRFAARGVPPILPKLLVFDLDNTLWTPELYQIRSNTVPVVDRDVALFPGARRILADLANGDGDRWRDTAAAIASRTNRVAWAEALLAEFRVGENDRSLSSLLRFREIVPGSKRAHFERLRAATGVAYRDMIFFDDDARLNLREIETMGVFCGHCPRGLTNTDLFERTVWDYSDRKSKNKKAWMGVTVSARSLPS